MVLYPTIPYPTLPYPTIPYNTLQYHTIPCNTLQYPKIPYITLQYPPITHNTPQYPTIQYPTIQYPTLQYPTILLAMVKEQKQTGLHVRYGAAKYNKLAKTKSSVDLPDFMENLHETCNTAKEGMESQFTRKMHSFGYDSKSIEDYLQNRILPRVVCDTYRFYSALLPTNYPLSIHLPHLPK